MSIFRIFSVELTFGAALPRPLSVGRYSECRSALWAILECGAALESLTARSSQTTAVVP